MHVYILYIRQSAVWECIYVRDVGLFRHLSETLGTFPMQMLICWHATAWAAGLVCMRWSVTDGAEVGEERFWPETDETEENVIGV